MSQCFRCNKPYRVPYELCEDCQKKGQAFVDGSQQTPTPSIQGAHANMVEQALHRLSDAARRIAVADSGRPRGPRPRASRLSPLRDISGDIQRHSTPLPQTSKHTPASQGDDLWSWYHDLDVDENENDWYMDDPLLSRHLPDSTESAYIDEDMRHAFVARQATFSLPSQRRRRTARLRVAFASLAILALLALTIDSILVSVAFLHPRPNPTNVNGTPTLTLSTNIASYGQRITLRMRHFSSSTRVSLTRDVQEPIITDIGTPFVQVRPDGATDVSILVASDWNPGFHTIEAEDTKTRNTANATLQIPSGPTRPSHLIIDSTQIDLGAVIQGSNIIEPLKLHNTGSGEITWSASSNQPWLLVSPSQDTFSSLQNIEIGGQSADLKPGDYQGRITFSSNVGAPEHIDVQMTVRPLSTNAQAVLAVTPALLSFTATDNGPDPNAQFLMISNPGSQPLNWSLGNGPLASGISQGIGSIDPNSIWLSTDITSGIVVPRTTTFMRISIHSHNLLPGTYNTTLVFSTSTGTTALNSPQDVNISLTVQPRCGLTLNSAGMSFTAIAGQSNPSNQALSFAATSSCPATIGWTATSSQPWLVITPASGQLHGVTSTTTAASVNIMGLSPGEYDADISIAAAQTTQSVAVHLTIQSPPPPTAPVIAASPLNLNFSTTLGQANPPGQAVTITNTGGSPLMWRTTVNLLASSWLGASPTGGTIPPGQSAQLTVNVSASALTPGTYVGQVVLNGTDTNNAIAGGSPQIVAINFVVSPPCTLVQPSSSALAFSTMQNASDPAPQSMDITANGNCSWPLNWNARIVGSAPWLKFSPQVGSFNASGQSATISVAPTLAGLAPGIYTAQVTISATDTSNQQAQGSPQTFSVTLTVLQPCSLQISASALTFTATQGQTPPPATQNLTLSETGSCARPVSWTAMTDSGSSTWLVLSTTSGSDTGAGGTVGVSVNITGLVAGTYRGSVTITATGSGGAAIQNNSQVIPITLTIA